MGNRLTPASRHTNSSSSNGGGGGGDVLPPDVVFDILLRLRLPGDQLCRLRGVCRSWRAVLSDPAFAAAHAARHPDQLVAAAEANKLPTWPGDVVKPIATSAAGTSSPRCCFPTMRAHLRRVLVVGAVERLRVVDPDTGLSDSLPDHGDHGGSFFVLGWAASTPTSGQAGYKVLSVTPRRGRDGGTQSCKVLTLGAGAGVWREAQGTPVNVRREPWAAAVANKGVVYILAHRRRSESERSASIAAFDLTTEQWRPDLIQGPPGKALSGLTEMSGRLVAVSGSFSHASAAVRLWSFTGRGDSDDAVWHKMCTVPISRIQRSHERAQQEPPSPLAIAEPMWVLDGGRVAFLVWSPVQLQGPGVARDNQNRWVLRVYDPRTKGFKDVARVYHWTDVAIGVYGGHNLLRA